MMPALLTFRRVVFCGQAAYDSAPRLLKRLLGRRGRVVPNGADFDRVDRALAGLPPREDDGTFRVVAIGRLDPVKDPTTLLDAFVAACTPDTHLTMIGDGSLADEVRAKVAASPVADRIEMTGLIPRDEVFRRCAGADLFVSASLGEGLPVAAMEAMGAGCPVVLSDIPPHRELAAGTTIPLVACGDVDGFARRIAEARALPVEERRARGAAAKAHVVTNFSLARMHRGYEAVYRDLCPWSDDRPGAGR